MLVQLNNAPVYRSTRGRLKDAAAHGVDTNRNPFYLRPGAGRFLRELDTLPGVRIGFHTGMKPSNYAPILNCLVQHAWGSHCKCACEALLEVILEDPAYNEVGGALFV